MGHQIALGCTLVLTVSLALPAPSRAGPADEATAANEATVGAEPVAAGEGLATSAAFVAQAPEAASGGEEGDYERAFGAHVDAVGARKDAWGSYGWGNYRPPATGTFYGRLKSEFRYEKADQVGVKKEDDQDFFQYVTLGTNGIGLEKLDTRFHGRWSKDIDGSRDPFSGNDVLIDARDVEHDHRHLFEIYSAYARYRSVEDLFDVTVGRQYVIEADWAHFDGVAIDAPRLGGLVSVGAFAGRRVHFYGEFDEKAVAGGHITFHATDRIDISVSDVASEDNLLEFKISAEPIDGLLIVPAFRMIQGDSDRLSLDVDYWNDDLGLDATFRVARQFTSADAFTLGSASADKNFVNDLDFNDRPRFRLPEPSASWEFEAEVYKEILPQLLGVQAGLIRMFVTEHSNENGWEGSHWNPWVALDVAPFDGLRLDARFSYADYHRPEIRVADEAFAEKLRGEGEDDWFEITVGGRYRMQELFTFGAQYSFREFSSRSGFEDKQRFNANGVRTWLRVDIIDGLSARVQYEYDEDIVSPEDGIRRSEAVWAHVEYAF